MATSSTLLGRDLSTTVDNVHAAFFAGARPGKAQREEAAVWIAARQGLPGAYAHTFALFDAEKKAGTVVFTGERMTSASARHIAGEEACIALLELEVKSRAVSAALGRATDGILARLHALDTCRARAGCYCCGKCTVAVWRHLGAGGLDHQDERMTQGAKYLQQHRNGDGEWRRFPFAYTVLALTAMPVSEARRELKYAAPVLERKLSHAPGHDEHAQRRHAVFAKALERG